MLLLGKLIEENKVDLDKPIYEYLGDKFPQKYFDNKKVNITLRYNLIINNFLFNKLLFNVLFFFF